MSNNNLLSAALVAAVAVAGLAPIAHADSIQGTTVVATSSFDGGAGQTFTFTDLAAGATTQSPLNLGGGSGDSIELVAGEPNGSSTRNELLITFSPNDIFVPSDQIDFTLTLSGQNFDIFSALTVADDVQVPTASENGNVLSFEMTNLDQISGVDGGPGLGGRVEYVFDAEPLTAAAPEPATLGMVVIGFAGLLFKVRRRA